MDELFDREDELVWTWSYKVAATRGQSHGGGDAPEGAYLEEFELDREETNADALEWWDSLPGDLRAQIYNRAHDNELDDAE